MWVVRSCSLSDRGRTVVVVGPTEIERPLILRLKNSLGN